jgi:hypothetical protein
MRRRLPVVPVLVVVLFSLAVAAVAASAWKSKPSAASPQLALDSHHLRLSQTRPNQALIKFPNAKPGEVARGTTVLSVTGTRATVQVRPNNLRDLPGPNGGKLVASRQLWIDIRCVDRPCPRPIVAYRGPLALMGTRSLGSWGPGVSYRYLVRVWLQRRGTPPTNVSGDNIFQGSAARFGLVWTVTTP